MRTIGESRVFILIESYAGTRKLSDIFADLLYSAYKRSEGKEKTVRPSDKTNRNGAA